MTQIYSCLECDQVFMYESLYRIHNERVHMKIKNSHCNVCKKGFYNENGLKAHRIAVHLKKKLYQCQKCKKHFSQQSSLNYHLKTQHLALKIEKDRIKCKKCFYKTQIKSNLNRHLKRKHSTLKTKKSIKSHESLSHKGLSSLINDKLPRIQHQPNKYNKLETKLFNAKNIELMNKSIDIITFDSTRGDNVLITRETINYKDGSEIRI